MKLILLSFLLITAANAELPKVNIHGAEIREYNVCIEGEKFYEDEKGREKLIGSCPVVNTETCIEGKKFRVFKKGKIVPLHESC